MKQHHDHDGDHTHDQNQSRKRDRDRDRPLPLAALLALAMAGFLTILTETLPAGLLLPIAASLSVSESMVGQMVTIYAIGSLVAAIPLVTLTQSWRRRPLLLLAISGFAVANSVTSFSSHYGAIMAGRLVAGVSAGVLWALLAGYAARMVPPHQKGRAIAVAMVGTPLALALGVPLATFIGKLIGWRLCFAAMSALALLLMLWVWRKVPDVAGQAAGARRSLGSVLALAGVRPVLWMVLVFVLAHNILYTYIAPLLAGAGLAERIDVVLLVFGVSALAGIWITGVLIDRHLRALTIASHLVFAIAALLLVLVPAQPAPVMMYLAVALWGAAFGGVPTLFQTALDNAAGAAADVAQSMLVTAWNLAIAGGGLVGGLLLDRYGVQAFAPTVLGLVLASLAVAWLARPVVQPVPGAMPSGS